MGEQVDARIIIKTHSKECFIWNGHILMGGEKGEACEIPEKRNEKDVLTYFSRVVLFHITGFYQ